MTLTIPVAHAAVTDNPRFPVLAECPREAVVLIRLSSAGLHAMRLRSGSVAAWECAERLGQRGVTDWRLVRDPPHPLLPAGDCDWCGQHVCKVCKGKHRRCKQRTAWGWLGRRPQWRNQTFAQWQRREVDGDEVLRGAP